MRFTVNRRSFVDHLTRVARLAASRAVRPTLLGVALSAAEGQFQATCHTNSGDVVAWGSRYGAASVDEPGQAIAPAAILRDTVKSLPGDTVTIETDDHDIAVSAAGGRSTIRQLGGVDDFPTEPDLGDEGLDVAWETVQPHVLAVAYAASTDRRRPILGGVCFAEGSTGLELVATDSYRLAVSETGIPYPAGLGRPLFPAKLLGTEIPRLTGGGEWGIIHKRDDGRWLTIAGDEGALTVRGIEGAFPNYRSLIPEATAHYATAPREAWLQALASAKTVAAGHVPVRVVSLNGSGVELTVVRQDVGGFTGYVEGSRSDMPEGMMMAFNWKYLSDAVAHGGDEPTLQIVDPAKPAVLRDGGRTNLIMPVRL